MLLVALSDPDQDLDGLLERGLLDHDRLEATLEGGVPLDVLAVLVEGRGADALELATRQWRLEDVGRIDRAFGRTRADEGVELVDEQDRVVRVTKLFDDLLESLLELAPVLRAGNERTDVQGQDALVEERLGDVAVDDPVGEAFRDGGLADARLTDQGGVVLRPPRQDLDDPLDLLLAADDRVELAGPGGLGQVDSQLVDSRGLAGPFRLLGRPGGRALGEDADDLVADLVEVDAQRLEDAGSDAFTLTDEAEQEVFGADVVVAQAAGFVDRQLDDLLGAGRERDLARRGRGIAPPDDELDGGADLRELDTE
jgi:hypothetical protein